MKNKQNSLLIIILLVLSVIFFSGCIATSITKIKDSDYVGKRVTVSGTVQNTIKIGELSGFTIEDDTGTISVSSDDLPVEGNKIRVTGVLMKDTIIGYYIKIN